jgi:Uncharacterized conserved protein (DUF2203)
VTPWKFEWNEEQVRVYLPRLRLLLAILRRSTGFKVRAHSNGHGQLAGALRAAGQEPVVPDEPDAPDAPVLPDIDPRTALAEIEALDIVLRDPKRGLCDFPYDLPSGRVVMLCWLEGEDDLGWWHFPDEGFAGRKPLPIPKDL